MPFDSLIQVPHRTRPEKKPTNKPKMWDLSDKKVRDYIDKRHEVDQVKKERAEQKKNETQEAIKFMRNRKKIGSPRLGKPAAKSGRGRGRGRGRGKR